MSNEKNILVSRTSSAVEEVDVDYSSRSRYKKPCLSSPVRKEKLNIKCMIYSQNIDGTSCSGIDGFSLWTPNPSLPIGSDYARQITQGQSDINYSGPFAVIGGTSSSSISYSGISTLPSATSNGTITSGATAASLGTGSPMSLSVESDRNDTFAAPYSVSTTGCIMRWLHLREG